MAYTLLDAITEICNRLGDPEFDRYANTASNYSGRAKSMFYDMVDELALSKVNGLISDIEPNKNSFILSPEFAGLIKSYEDNSATYIKLLFSDDAKFIRFSKFINIGLSGFTADYILRQLNQSSINNGCAAFLSNFEIGYNVSNNGVELFRATGKDPGILINYLSGIERILDSIAPDTQDLLLIIGAGFIEQAITMTVERLRQERNDVWH